MTITNLVNATQGDSSRSQSRLARTGRQRTFVINQDEKLSNQETSLKISTKDDKEPTPSTSKQDDALYNQNPYPNRQTRTSNLIRTLNSSRLNRSSKLNSNDEENSNKFNKSSFEYDRPFSSQSDTFESSANQLSSNIRNKMKFRFKRISVDENQIKKEEEQKEFEVIKDKVDNRLDRTYLWKNKLISMITGKDNLSNDKLITYQIEYDFFTRQSKSIKQPNILENQLHNQLRSYLEGNHNLYYPSLKKANMLLAYPNLNEQVKEFIKKNDLPLNRVTQRILIEKNEHLEQIHLDPIVNSKKDLFELSTNIEKINLEDILNQERHQDRHSRNERKVSLNDRTNENQEQQLEEQSVESRPLIDKLNLESITLRFFKHKHSLREMNLTSEIVSNLEYINELNATERIQKLTTKIQKLKEVIDLIESCVQEYETKIDSGKQSTNESNKYVQKTSLNLVRNYLHFLNFLYVERWKLVQNLRTKIFNLLKNWKEVNNLRQVASSTDLNLHFDEQFESVQNRTENSEQTQLNSLIEERLEFEKKYAQFKRSNQFRFRSMLNRFVNQSESHENLIPNPNQNQENEETIYLNIRNNAVLLDGRLPGEPKFINFQITNDNPINESNQNAVDQIKLAKLKERKYLLQIFNHNKLIYETTDRELDSNLQVSFAHIEFKDLNLFDYLITFHLIEIKKNRKKLLSKLELNVQQIFIETLLHNTTKFSIKNEFGFKASTGELVLNLIKSEDRRLDRLVDRNVNDDSSVRELADHGSTFEIKYEFNEQKLRKFEYKEIRDESDKLYFIYKMINEIYNQQELNKLLEIIKKETYQNELNNQVTDQTYQDKQSDQMTKESNLFVNTNQIELNQRLALLKQRNEEEDELNRRRIPLYNSHYLSFLIKDKEQINKTKSNYLPIELHQTNLNVDLLKAYDTKRKTIIDYLIEVRKKFINQSNTWNKDSKNYEDYVHEEIDTSLSNLNFDFLFLNRESNRPLRPERKERKKYGQSLIQQNLNSKTGAQSTNQNEKVKIMINIMSGINIPVRRSHTPHLTKGASITSAGSIAEVSDSQQFQNQNYANFTKRLNELFHDEMHSYNSLDSIISKNIAIDLSLKDQKVCPFLEISFQDQIAQTSVAESSQPSWNESIKLNLNVQSDDYSPANLLKIDDFIYLNLFDHVEVVREDELDLERKFSEETVPKKYVKNWLGSISIPFITLYLNGKIEGSFNLNKPIYLTGYDFENKPTFSLLTTTGHVQELDAAHLNNLDSKKNSYLTIYLTIDPQLNLPSKIDLKCSTDEDSVVYNYAKDWQVQLKRKYPKRLIKSLVINLINNKHTLVCRYLSPLEPPSNFLDTEQYSETTKDYKNVLMKNLARYVSLIPLITNELVSIGLVEDIWPDCEQFLKMNIGCIEEHAILLCNYFLYLGLNCGLVLGQSVPEGKTCYVIVWLNELTKKRENYLNVQLWNPISGQCYFVNTDNFLPLSSADCIITRNNVYANIQKEDQPNQITFNVNLISCWKPLFNTGKLKVNLTTIQPNKFEYEAVSESYVSSLEQQIEVYLKESLMKWRRQKKTFFNRFCAKEIKKELAKMEYKICNLKDIDPNEEINKLLSTYKLNGIELNLPFNGIDNLVKQIYSTGIHLNRNEKVDFVLSVHLHGYAQNVFSVWIYYCTCSE